MHTACTVRRWVTSSGLSFAKGDTSRDVFVEEGVDAAAVGVAETQVAEEDRVDLRNGVDVAVEHSHRPRGTTDEHAMRSASRPGRCKVGRVESGVGSGRENQRALWVHDNFFPLLRISLPPGRVGHVGHDCQVRSCTRGFREVFMALLHHLMQVSILVHRCNKVGYALLNIV